MQSKREELSAAHAAELVARCQAGDRRALDQLVEEIYPVVYRIVRVRMSGKLRLHVESDDLVQETFIPIVQTIERFHWQDGGRFVNWLARIVERKVNDMLDRYQAQKRGDGRVRSLEEVVNVTRDEPGVVLIAPAPDPERAVEEADEIDRVDACLARLPELEREVILLRDLAEAAWSYVAEELGLTSQTAARELHREARIRLARLVRQGG